MYLSELFKGIATTSHTLVTGLSLDSREIKPGYLFIVISKNAASYVAHAIQQGAIAILIDMVIDSKIEIIYHPNPILIAHILAARFFPLQPTNIMAVTGTNGKTSTTNFCKQIYQLAGLPAASIGTLGIDCPGLNLEQFSSLTTPSCTNLHYLLYQLAKAGINNISLEASSHALVQYRMHSVQLKAAAFTNFSHEHLDYHISLKNYYTAKLKLFREILPLHGKLVLNADIKQFSLIKTHVEQPIITYGYNSNDFKILQQIPDKNGQFAIYKIYDKTYKAFLPLLGKFQLYNLLCAMALVSIPTDKINLMSITGIPGRMELVKIKQRSIIIDYAHTPNALKHCLEEVRWHFPISTITVVFGCGGDRDKNKRISMGKVAAQKAQIVIICDDNPRSESPELIRQEILKGCPNGIEISNRKKAIVYAIQHSPKEGVIVIAGKGHENLQVYADVIEQHNDKEYLLSLS